MTDEAKQPALDEVREATAGDEAYDVEDSDDDLEVEIVDDVRPEDRPRRAENAAPEIPDDDDLENYSESVQKRLKKLTFEAREAERQRQEAIRQREEAVEYARRVHAQNESLQKQSRQGQAAMVEQAKERAAAQLASAESAYRQAYEAGDTDALLDAQRKMTAAQYDLQRFAQYRPPAEPQAPQTPAYQPQNQAPQLNARQRTWLANNQWYGQNAEMTAIALAAHERLVKSGVDPDSDTYYNQIDEAVRRRFPEEFSEGQEEVKPAPRKAKNVVAPAGRTQTSPRKVKLTPSQVAIAKRLGVTPQQYAAQLLKEQANG